jgi:WD40 repeat protein
VWDVKAQKELTQLKGHEQPVTAVVFTDNEKIVTASMDRTIRLWTTMGAKSEPKPEPKPKDKKDVKGPKDKKDDKKGPKDKKDPKDEKKEPYKDPKELKKFGPTTDDPYAVAWSEKTKQLAVCGYSGLITVWALDADKPKFTKAIKNPGYCIAFSGDGKGVYTGHDNGTVVFTPIGAGK